jgi:wyosine [tRNA(Phe)-imidazoG37] synthetase (radical SAM superfamily)
MRKASPGARRGGGRSRFVYGPVPSRRLGYSLGVDIVPYKTCTLDCLYCQLGSVRRTTCRRQAFFSVRAVLAQIREALASGRTIDVITFSGSGEPTLNRNLGPLIREIKKMTRVPVAVLTNGTLLYRKDVRRDLMAADIVIPSLDAALVACFRAVNRPHPSLRLPSVIRGLALFRKDFKGRLWLEVMLVEGVNDGREALAALKRAIALIHPDRVQLNTVVRPPAYPAAHPLSPRKMDRVRRFLGGGAEIITDFAARRPSSGSVGLESAITAVVRRRPVTAEDIAAALGLHRDEVLKAAGRLLESGKIRPVRHGGKIFYEPA